MTNLATKKIVGGCARAPRNKTGSQASIPFAIVSMAAAHSIEAVHEMLHAPTNFNVIFLGGRDHGTPTQAVRLFFQPSFIPALQPRGAGRDRRWPGGPSVNSCIRR